MRVLVTGGRDYTDRERVFETLDRIHAKKSITCLIHGDAPGADTLASQWAASRRVAELPFSADWNNHYGNRAGNVRNSRMLRFGKPDLVVAFPGRSGTADMKLKAREAGIKVIQIKPRVASA